MIVYCWIVFLAGGAGGALLMHLGDRPALRATQQQLASCQGDLQKSQGEASNYRSHLQNLTGSTMIYEWQPAQTTIFHGLVSIGAAGQTNMGQYVQRWMLPIRIQPILRTPQAQPPQFILTDATGHQTGPFPAQMYGQAPQMAQATPR
jgi:hypothetical protein